ncbi:class I SAM-dependent methyltransferase [Aggregatimonas sangjinii]|uniref:Class I SAM-dependent methyltransferase n=1 Tax=Aggregatimonas sangjinii TaxID=2583587 RepID=A0A5B7SSE9_9FLAO|nr:class I SAM-dependent methyltransferase [Aggregatimonas sangjinii]QCX01596.1 class I SAM-dependent methyltransferase [Aggregatimonas sangjinii]
MIPLQHIAYQSVGLTLLKEFIENEQLSQTNFFRLDELLAITGYEYRQGRISKEEIAEINNSFGRTFLEHTLHGRGFLKPNGYPGDYLFLDRIYTHHISADPRYGIWDQYVQQNGAPDAVRNRKEYFKHMVRAKAKTVSRLNVLNIISGSGRELEELYDSVTDQNIDTTCVEIDEEAIEFSKELNKNQLDRIEYVHSNIFRYQTEESFDFIWAAGLFDYLNDKAFIKLLRRFAAWQKKGGEIVIGNYNEAHNPSRDYMEILGDWHLIHRTEAQLLQLAKKAGFSEDEIHVSRMPDNVILYLHIQTL